MINLAEIQAHCRPERVQDLIDDLVMLCEDALAGLQSGDPHLILRVIQGAAK
jgi:hypothetical protein